MKGSGGQGRLSSRVGLEKLDLVHNGEHGMHLFVSKVHRPMVRSNWTKVRFVLECRSFLAGS